MNKIITISREFGSGGRELGYKLSQKLGYAYYDKEIINAIVEKCGFNKEYVESVLENKVVHIYPLSFMNSFAMPYGPMPEISVLSAQNEILKEFAKKSDCVIVGRCSDFILQEYCPLNIFVYADMPTKIARCKAKATTCESLSDKEIAKQIAAIDKNRAKYYEYITGNKWGAKENYHLCFNTSKINIDDLVEVIAANIVKNKTE